MRRLSFLPGLALLAACSPAADDGIVDVAYLGKTSVFDDASAEWEPHVRLLREAQAQGLVRLNAAGEVVPGLAERWIVTDDGTSYIFRITEFDLPDGGRLSAQDVATGLQRAVTNVRGTALGLDLAKIRDIRAMTGRVIEIRLRAPMPGFLQLLAQAELGIVRPQPDTGPMTATREGDTFVFQPLPPEQRGLAAQPDWNEIVRTVRIAPLPPRQAVRAFEAGTVDMLIGGRLETLPLAITGTLSRGTVRLDSAIGLFGLDVRNAEGFLALSENREAVSMAIDRPGLVENFNLDGWSASSRLVAPLLPGDDGSVGQQWEGLSLEQRRAIAARRVEAFSGDVRLTIHLPPGPGSRLLYRAIERDLRSVGIALERVEGADAADLVLRDSVARFAGARWFLNQFNCAVSRPVCSEDADFLVQLSLDAQSTQEEASYLAEAELALTKTHLYLPLGSPVRWSQVRAGVDGFAENVWAHHPLFPLSRAPM